MKILSVLALLASSLAAQAGQPRLVPDASIVWSDSDPLFGGLSGVEILDGGRGVLAIGDRGIWVEGALTRENGTLTGAKATRIAPLLGVKGNSLQEKERDAEGLTLDAEGRAYVSFEGIHRIRRYDEVGGKATAIPGYSAFKNLSWNLGLEAIAMDADDVLYAIPERPRGGGPTAPVYRFKNGVWDDDLSFPRRDSFFEVDADFGPDGRLYVLERKFKWLGGFATKVRSFRLGQDGLEDEQTLLKTGFGKMDNMEGISVWKDDQGQIRVTLLSDDNFFPLQQTILAEFLLKDDGPAIE